MGDIIDQAQENDELFRKASLQKHFSGRSQSKPRGETSFAPLLCTDCEEPIPEKRLKVNPEATRCVTCQTLAEKRGHDDE